MKFYGPKVLVGATSGCHYYVAIWTKELTENEPTMWTAPAEDPNDPDPVVSAQWITIGRCAEVLAATSLGRSQFD